MPPGRIGRTSIRRRRAPSARPSRRRWRCSNSGQARVAEKTGAEWQVNQWLKKAVLLSFRLNDMERRSRAAPAAPAGGTRCRSKFDGWGANRLRARPASAPCRAAIVRRGAYIAPGVVLMPSFVNLGAYVDEGTMVDTWATVGSCAQIGKNVHISGGVGIGGVLEPLQAGPMIIEDNCFIGARSEVVEGVIVGEGSVLSMGVFIGASTKIVDRDDRRGLLRPACRPIRSWCRARCPASRCRTASPARRLYCAVIVKRVDAQTRAKTSINELLRD